MCPGAQNLGSSKCWAQAVLGPCTEEYPALSLPLHTMAATGCFLQRSPAVPAGSASPCPRAQKRLSTCVLVCQTCAAAGAGASRILAVHLQEQVITPTDSLCKLLQ